MPFRKMFVDELEKLFTNVGFDAPAEGRVIPYYLSITVPVFGALVFAG